MLFLETLPWLLETLLIPKVSIKNCINPLSSWIVTVTFSQSSYNVSETSGQLQVTLILSSAVFTIITVQVSSTNVSAYGKCHNLLWTITSVHGILYSRKELNLVNCCTTNAKLHLFCNINKCLSWNSTPHATPVLLESSKLLCVSCEVSLFSTIFKQKGSLAQPVCFLHV